MSRPRHGASSHTPQTPAVGRRASRARDFQQRENRDIRGESRPIPQPPLQPQQSPVPLPTVEEVSAGGMVVREHRGRHEVAIIARYNRGGRLEWVLPKGHPEGDEQHHEAALREVEEETGIAGDILTPLGVIDYWFTVSSHRVHKTVHHFLLRATGGELTIENDPDHEAVDVAWVDLDRLPSRLTFLNERRIVEVAREIMHHYFDGVRPDGASGTPGAHLAGRGRPTPAPAPPAPGEFPKPGPGPVTAPQPLTPPNPPATPDTTSTPDTPKPGPHLGGRPQ